MNEKNLSFGLIALTALFVAGSSSVVWAQDLEVLAGFDLFGTDDTQTEFLGIEFGGVPLDPPIFDFAGVGSRAIGVTDTIVQRLEVASSPLGGTDTIDIELVALSLRSQDQFDLDGPGPLPLDFLYVTLQKDRTPDDELAGFPVGPRSLGMMDITFVSADAGTFDSHFIVFIDLRCGPDGDIVCDFLPLPACAEFDAGFPLGANDVPWGRIPPPESLRIPGVNRFLAGAGDAGKDFWAPVDPDGFRVECIPHTGHQGGVTISHCTGATSCLTSSIGDGSGCDGQDNNCNGEVDECAEDVTLPVPICPGECTQECDPPTDVSPDVCGFATATDDCSPPVNITREDFVTPQCGDTFNVARIWTATDNCGNAAPCLQPIFVEDTTPPTIECPPDTRILWTADRSPDANGFATGADTCGEVNEEDIEFDDASLPGVCLSVLITRTWTATDECDNETPCDQIIDVRGPRDALEDLIAFLESLSIRQGIANALRSKLKNATNKVCGGKAIPAVNILEAFINQVLAQSGKAIPPDDADELIARAQAIIAAIEDGGACPDGCP